MNIKKLDISKPRRRYYRDGFSLDCCPECGAKLVGQMCTVILHVKSSDSEAQFATNHNGSFFCQSCPVVVFDKDMVQKAAIGSLPSDNNRVDFRIVGIINTDALPSDKQVADLGTDETPIPLIRFLPNMEFKPMTSTQTKPSRNDICTCGSGLKYKKCCGKD